MKAAEFVRRHVVGVDAFWDGVPEDGHLDSKTKFGKCYVIPFPFTVGIYYDDGEDNTYLTSEGDILHLAKVNQDDEVKRRRKVWMGWMGFVGGWMDGGGNRSQLWGVGGTGSSCPWRLAFFFVFWLVPRKCGCCGSS